MGIDETVKEICDKKPKLRGIVLGVRFSDEEREQIRAKAKRDRVRAWDGETIAGKASECFVGNWR